MTLPLADQERLAAIEGRRRDYAFPPQLVVENTSYCNLRCVHCCHKEMVRPRRHMERGLGNKIVEEVGRESPECELWPAFYGETLILGRNRELWSRLDYAASTPTARSWIAGTTWRRSWPRRSAALS